MVVEDDDDDEDGDHDSDDKAVTRGTYSNRERVRPLSSSQMCCAAASTWSKRYVDGAHDCRISLQHCKKDGVSRVLGKNGGSGSGGSGCGGSGGSGNGSGSDNVVRYSGDDDAPTAGVVPAVDVVGIAGVIAVVAAAAVTDLTKGDDEGNNGKVGKPATPGPVDEWNNGNRNNSLAVARFSRLGSKHK